MKFATFALLFSSVYGKHTMDEFTRPSLKSEMELEDSLISMQASSTTMTFTNSSRNTVYSVSYVSDQGLEVEYSQLPPGQSATMTANTIGHRWTVRNMQTGRTVLEGQVSGDSNQTPVVPAAPVVPVAPSNPWGPPQPSNPFGPSKPSNPFGPPAGPGGPDCPTSSDTPPNPFGPQPSNPFGPSKPSGKPSGNQFDPSKPIGPDNNPFAGQPGDPFAGPGNNNPFGPGNNNPFGPGNNNPFGPQPQKPAAPAKPVATTGTGCQREFTMLQLRKHNEYRRLHGVPDLIFDQGACNTSAAWSQHLADIDNMVHSDRSQRNNCGENLYMAWSSRGPSNFGDEVTTAWYDEISMYDFSRPGFGMQTGHFTQVVWKGTTKLGCAQGGNYVTCHYCEVAGNMQGDFPRNVLPPIGFAEVLELLELQEYLLI